MATLTVAELKRRLTVGTKLVQTLNLRGPCENPRTVAEVSTTEVRFSGPGSEGVPESRLWSLPWPKASLLRETPDGFEDRLRAGPRRRPLPLGVAPSFPHPCRCAWKRTASVMSDRRFP